MKVEKLTLRDFRNIRESTLSPDPHLNFLVGPNGQGKTSFLEALGFLATLRSFRESKAAEVITWGEKHAEILCSVCPDELDGGKDWRTELKISFELTDQAKQKASKVAFINGKPFKSSTSYLSQRFGNFELGFHTVVFNPSDHDLVRGEPSLRRSYLNQVLSAQDGEYLKTLQKYQRTLDQRNALLKTDPSPSRELLQGFTVPLAAYSAALTYRRLKYLQELAPLLNDISRQIAPKQAPLKLLYLSNWAPKIGGLSIENENLGAIHFSGQEHLPSVELLEQAFWSKWSILESAERRSGHSLVGPHRDDWTFFLGNQVLKGHGSQGEIRSALLALKLSEIEQFRNATGHRPLFLLDDFSSELDQERRSFLLRFLTNTDLQVFVTTTENTAFSNVGKRFWVLNGRLHDDAAVPG